MNALTRWIRSLGETSQDLDASPEPAGGTESIPRDAPKSSLYSCPECESVYVAIDKATCSDCDTPVEQVPSTLAKSR